MAKLLTSNGIPGINPGNVKTASSLDAAQRFIVAEGYERVKVSELMVLVPFAGVRTYRPITEPQIGSDRVKLRDR